MPFPLEDQVYISAYNKINSILTKNLAVVSQVLKIYNQYSYILNEKDKVAKFIESKPKREQYSKMIQNYQELYQQVHSKLPFYINMNMVQVDCVDVKKNLLATINELIAMMLNGINNYLLAKNTEIYKEIEIIH